MTHISISLEFMPFLCETNYCQQRIISCLRICSLMETLEFRAIYQVNQNLPLLIVKAWRVWNQTFNNFRDLVFPFLLNALVQNVSESLLDILGKNESSMRFKLRVAKYTWSDLMRIVIEELEELWVKDCLSLSREDILVNRVRVKSLDAFIKDFSWNSWSD